MMVSIRRAWLALLLLVTLFVAARTGRIALDNLQALAYQGSVSNGALQNLSAERETRLRDMVARRDSAKFWKFARVLEGEGLNRRERLVRSLSVSPVDTYAWYQLAREFHQLGEEPDRVVDALELSIYASPFELPLLTARIELAVPYLNYLDSDTRSLLANQIALARLHPATGKRLDALWDRNDATRLALQALSTE